MRREVYWKPETRHGEACSCQGSGRGCGGIRDSFQNKGEEDSLHVEEEKEKGEKKEEAAKENQRYSLPCPSTKPGRLEG